MCGKLSDFWGEGQLSGPRVAFVACNRNAGRFRGDPSFIHRCENLAHGLDALGIGTELMHLTSLPLRPRHEVAVLHRPRHSLRLRVATSLLRRAGVRLVADVDDLVFDEGLAGFSPGVMNGLLTLKETRDQFSANRRALERFELITVSTEPLAEHVRRCFPSAQVVIVPNGVPRQWRSLPRRSAPPDAPVITYLPGTRSHDRDFAVYAEGVAAFLAKYLDARLEVTGPLKFTLPARPGQVVHCEKVPFERYHERVWGGWANLAPLEATPFTRCKSALKVLEAGWWGVPTVCSPIPDAQRFDGAGALFAHDAEGCYMRLESMMDAARYRGLTEGLPARVLAVADVDREAARLLGLVERIAADLEKPRVLHRSP